MFCKSECYASEYFLLNPQSLLKPHLFLYYRSLSMRYFLKLMEWFKIQPSKFILLAECFKVLADLFIKLFISLILLYLLEINLPKV